MSSGEMRLMLDYIGNRSAKEIRKDPALKQFNQKLTDAISEIVGPDQAL